MESLLRKDAEHRPERLNGPEWFANPPLENTSLVYSVPFRGEWDNGQVLRYLQAMLSQNVAKGEALEIELVANYGGLDHFLREKEGDYFESERFQEARASAFDKIRQTKEANDFLKSIVEVQGFARQIILTDDEAAKQAIRQTISSTQDLLKKDLLILAARKAETVSVALLNTTDVDFRDSPFEGADLSVIRTVGMDCASLRFAHNPNVAMSMSDVDTVPLDTHTAREVQEIYAHDPKITYVFLSMSDQAKGVSRAVAGNPSMSRHIDYNNHVAHGSPQITFRLRAYDKLKEIACHTIFGNEDRDTSARLAYHFGSLQDGLLFEASRVVPVSPRVLTADRVDGFMDGRPRSEHGEDHRFSRDIENDLKGIAEFREEVFKRIALMPAAEADVARGVLASAREKELERERLQRRMNRLVVLAFLKAMESGWVRSEHGKTVIDEARLTEMQGGKALQFFLRMNPLLISEILATPEDVAALRYFSGVDGDGSNLPNEFSRFHSALRDYLGEVVSCNELVERGLCRETPSEDGKTSEFSDLRPPESRVSFWHGMTAELLALGHTYRLFFQTDRFMQYRSPSNWPQAWGGPDGMLKFKPLEERKAWLKRVEEPSRLHVEPEAGPVSVPTTAQVPPQRSWSDRFSFASIPGFAAFRRLFGRNE